MNCFGSVHVEHGGALFIDINKDGCPYAAAPSLYISIKMDVHAAAPSLLISIKMDVHAAAPSLLISIKMDAHMQQRPLYRYQ